MLTKQRVVILAPNWLGDVVMALPAIRDLQRHFADAHLTVAARASVAKVFRAVPGVDQVLTFQRRSEEITQLEVGRFDVAILFPFISIRVDRSPSRYTRAMGYRTDFRGPLLTKRVSRRKHASILASTTTGSCGAGHRDWSADTGHQLAGVDHSGCAHVVGGTRLDVGAALIGIAPGAAFGHAKRWPPTASPRSFSGARRNDAACVLLGPTPIAMRARRSKTR